MRRLLTLSTILVALALAASATAAADVTFAFRGGGYGHGVGMGQWGAYGFAKNGWTYDRILGHYYRGTTLGPAPTKRLRVLLASGRASVEISSEAPFTAAGGGRRVELPAGTVTVSADLTVSAGGETHRLDGPIRFEPGSKPLRFGRPYRGALVVHRDKGSLSVVNAVKLEHYVYAIVPHEMPWSWELEALKVQAVAARTYAIASIKKGSFYDFAHNPVAQAYEGIEEEHPRTTQAVNATAGEIVLYEGKPAWTFYSSSSGGRTATLADAYPGGGKDLPYLQSVEDPYDSLSPYHEWTVRFSAAELGRKLDLPGPPDAVRLELGVSGRVRALVASGAGWTKRVPGPTVRTSLGLRSTLFTVRKQQTPRAALAQHVP